MAQIDKRIAFTKSELSKHAQNICTEAAYVRFIESVLYVKVMALRLNIKKFRDDIRKIFDPARKKFQLKIGSQVEYSQHIITATDNSPRDAYSKILLTYGMDFVFDRSDMGLHMVDNTWNTSFWMSLLPNISLYNSFSHNLINVLIAIRCECIRHLSSGRYNSPEELATRASLDAMRWNELDQMVRILKQKPIFDINTCMADNEFHAVIATLVCGDVSYTNNPLSYHINQFAPVLDCVDLIQKYNIIKGNPIESQHLLCELIHRYTGPDECEMMNAYIRSDAYQLASEVAKRAKASPFINIVAHAALRTSRAQSLKIFNPSKFGELDIIYDRFSRHLILRNYFSAIVNINSKNISTMLRMIYALYRSCEQIFKDETIELNQTDDIFHGETLTSIWLKLSMQQTSVMSMLSCLVLRELYFSDFIKNLPNLADVSIYDKLIAASVNHLQQHGMGIHEACRSNEDIAYFFTYYDLHDACKNMNLHIRNGYVNVTFTMRWIEKHSDDPDFIDLARASLKLKPTHLPSDHPIFNRLDELYMAMNC